jgi:hypothetical protein
MNWEVFSSIGYVSIALWLCMPLLWLLHMLIRPRRWLCHIALVFGIAAFALAKVNSQTHVSLIQVDRSQQIADQLAQQERARQAAIDERGDEVAQIRFAEDGSGDFLDTAGMTEADRKYFESRTGNPDTNTHADGTPDWKKQKKTRSVDTGDGSLESLIGAKSDRQGIESQELIEDEPPAPILMSDKDKLLADRLDAGNLTAIRIMLLLSVIVIVWDYFRRANVYREGYFPLPLPSSWANAMKPRDAVSLRSASPRRSLVDELRVFTRRGESFVYITDNQADAREAMDTPVYRLPFKCRSVDVIAIDDPTSTNTNPTTNDQSTEAGLDDDFIFETLWHGLSSFVIGSATRGEQLLARIETLLTQRKASRAHTKRTVNIVWNVGTPVSEALQHRFANLGQATGFTVLLCQNQSENDTKDTHKHDPKSY